MHRVREKLTYSNVISTLCLVLLLGGGTAYAATKLGKNSVGTKQLQKGAVTPAKLSKASKKTLQGPAGPQGIQGPVGKEGSAGKEGPQGPGAVTVEGIATPTPQVLATYSGVEVVDQCSGGNAVIEVQSTVGNNSLTEFGTVVEGSTVIPRQGEGISGQTVSGSTVTMDLFVRDNNVTEAFSRVDIHLSGSTCKLVGVITPSTVQ